MLFWNLILFVAAVSAGAPTTAALAAAALSQGLAAYRLSGVSLPLRIAAALAASTGLYYLSTTVLAHLGNLATDVNLSWFEALLDVSGVLSLVAGTVVGAVGAGMPPEEAVFAVRWRARKAAKVGAPELEPGDEAIALTTLGRPVRRPVVVVAVAG